MPTPLRPCGFCSNAPRCWSSRRGRVPSRRQSAGRASLGRTPTWCCSCVAGTSASRTSAAWRDGVWGGAFRGRCRGPSARLIFGRAAAIRRLAVYRGAREVHMDNQFILRSIHAGGLTLTMNRPDVLISCNRGMVTELRQAFESAGTDATVRAGLLTGAGRAFCAGQDLAEAVPPAGKPAPDIGDVVVGYNGLILAIRRLEKPVVAAVNGVAAGAGANIALAADFVIASAEASFIQAFVK